MEMLIILSLYFLGWGVYAYSQWEEKRIKSGEDLMARYCCYEHYNKTKSFTPGVYSATSRSI